MGMGTQGGGRREGWGLGEQGREEGGDGDGDGNSGRME